MKKAVIVIPSLNPDNRLTTYCEDLIKAGFTRIILIDDGSDAMHRPVFDALSEKKECIILRHAVNLGKGRALKNAINTFLNFEDVDDFCGIITADSDGQHSVADVVRIQEAMADGENKLFLGTRDFDLSHVPTKSRLGNKITRTIFRLLYGAKLRDTQTGLRGIPTAILPKYIDLYGERYDYETAMLIATSHYNIEFEEIIIETIYENNNEGSHFNPIRDSFSIYKLLFGTFFKYIFSSFLSFLIDIGLFKLLLSIITGLALSDGRRIVIATVVARVFSSLFNFTVNKNIVFKADGKNGILLLKYYILCIIQMGCSAGLVTLIFNYLPIPETIIKVVVDAVLFVISYQIQRIFIFKEKN